MTAIPFGAIVLTAFPFTDLSAAKRRPALVISTDNARRNDVVVAYITSSAQAWRDSAQIDATPANGLKVPSRVRFDKIATIDKAIIAGTLGNAEPVWLARHRETFFAVFGFARP